MKRTAYLLMFMAVIAFACGACTKISLSKGGTTGGGDSANANATPPGGNILGDIGNMVSGKTPPSVNGDWRIAFDYQGQTYEAMVTLAQQGKALTGQGSDAAGPFIISNGAVDGTKIHFTKKYADADPSRPQVDYSGDLTFNDDADYKGWLMSGHYKTTVNAAPYDDKWLATSIASEQASAQAKQQAEQAAQQPPPQAQQAAPAGGGDQVAASDGDGPNISGQYQAEYEFNFKKTFSKLWLEQDGHNVSGHGVDTNTNEHFTVAKGWYHYPKLTLVCKYVKGKQAAQNRDLTVRATVAGGPSFKGETQFGGAWGAKVVR